MKNLSKGIVIALILAGLAGCSEMNSWYGGADDIDNVNSNFQSDDAGGRVKPKMKITRGTGYGDEVPYSSKYAT